jgi:hypothetical protein
MKKWFLICAILLLAGVVFLLYFLKPAPRKVIGIHSGISIVHRSFLDTSAWRRWWPVSAGYRIDGVFYNDVRIMLNDRGEDRPVSLRLAQMKDGSVLLAWEGELSRGGRWVMDSVLAGFKAFAEDDKNIYGVDFRHTMSKDSTLISIVRVEAGYPSTDYIYSRIDSLRKYADANGAHAINNPFMSVTEMERGQYRVQIALSLDKTLTGNDQIVIKRFVPYKMIEGDVRGGVQAVKRGMEELLRYRDDQKLSIMALPFQILITDRRQETDSSKWVTRVTAPIS